ncbi:hypothetical protein [Mucilaginibacter xinganensis]|uniref:Uncharacterized protein n=1 Tax=Mucilaginibacter xinganensis TaxID=1234841 RepID=A0A223NXD4_9SPHI|nr:hypothetical protein [Mucilaginibacter xinganensis]ASU34354.1 hypothetical protein MuYL_2467 [Mucilaginibacter xinganensis]
METIQMPKSRAEQLNELEVGGSLPIENEDRKSWANTITRVHSDTIKQFTIRTDRDENKQTRVWRLKDIQAAS